MGTSKRKITNGKRYNQALVNRGSIIFWLDESAINDGYCQQHYGGRGRSFQFSNTAIETVLMFKGIFKLSLRATEGLINSLFRLMSVHLAGPNYSCISKRAKTVDIKYRNSSRGSIEHVVVDVTGLKVEKAKMRGKTSECMLLYAETALLPKSILDMPLPNRVPGINCPFGE